MNLLEPVTKEELMKKQLTIGADVQKKIIKRINEIYSNYDELVWINLSTDFLNKMKFDIEKELSRRNNREI